MTHKISIFLIILVLIILGCDVSSPEKDTTKPEIDIIITPLRDVYEAGTEITITMIVTDNDEVDTSLTNLTIYYDHGILPEDFIEIISHDPYSIVLNSSEIIGELVALGLAVDISGNASYLDKYLTIEQNLPPEIPHNLLPNDSHDYTFTNAKINWECENLSGEERHYDLYLGIYNGYENPPPLLVEGLTSTFFLPDLEYNEHYHWKVVARDSEYEVESERAHFYTVGEEIALPEMVDIEGGNFLMGDYFSEGGEDEFPVHEVYLDDFAIGKYEVTIRDFISFLNNAGVDEEGMIHFYQITHSESSYYPIIYDNGFQFQSNTYCDSDMNPMYNVNYNDATIYCNWLSDGLGLERCYNNYECDYTKNGFRLPTEAEWEYAARGGVNWADSLRFSGCHESEELESYAVYMPYYLHPIGSKLPNQLGIYDMSGNVNEWCNDYKDYPDSSYYQQCYDQGVVENPTGSHSGSMRAARGGSKGCYPEDIRVSRRSFRDGYYPDTQIGIRLVRNQ